MKHKKRNVKLGDRQIKRKSCLHILQQSLSSEDCVELRVFSFKTACKFGHSPFIYPRREFNILCAYAEAFPLPRTGGPRNICTLL